MSQLLRARRVLTEQGWLDDHQLRIENGVIAAIEPVPAARRISIRTSTAARAWT